MDFKSYKNLILSRRSVRDFNSTTLDDNILKEIVDMGRNAPSACNKQPWIFYVISSDEMKENLRTCYSKPWFKTAQAYIVIVGKPQEAWTFLDNSSTSVHIDTTIAATHMMLAAEALGVSSTWVCAFDRQKCAKILEIDFRTHEPISILALGYTENEKKEKLPHKRKEESEVVFWK